MLCCLYFTSPQAQVLLPSCCAWIPALSCVAMQCDCSQLMVMLGLHQFMGAFSNSLLFLSVLRFDNDFETIRYLGRGGFGKVFHVRNAFDGQPYAVKRIRLPTK